MACMGRRNPDRRGKGLSLSIPAASFLIDAMAALSRKTHDLQIGIIGSGGRGALLGSLAHRPGRGARVVACCDVAPAALAQNRADYGTGLFTTADYRALLDRDLDAVIIATPDFLHEDE